jgi:hypothetical protein
MEVGNRRKGSAGLVDISFLAIGNVRGDGQLGKMPMLVPFNEIKGVHFLIRNTLLRDQDFPRHIRRMAMPRFVS